MSAINRKPIPEQFIANKEQRLQKEEVKRAERCPHIIRKRAGDETYDLCELTERPSGRIQSCLIEHGLYECDTWNQIKEEEL